MSLNNSHNKEKCRLKLYDIKFILKELFLIYKSINDYNFYIINNISLTKEIFLNSSLFILILLSKSGVEPL